MNKLRAAVMAVLLIMVLPACKVKQKAAKKETLAANKVADSIALANKLNEQIANKQALIDSLKPVWNHEINYKTFAGKAKMHYEAGDQKQDFTANIRIQKDQIIWVSATALGGIVQVARIYITPDSFKMINYLDKSVTMMTLAQAEALLPTPMDYSVLQNVIVGNVMSKANPVSNALSLSDSWVLATENDRYVQEVTYNKADSAIRLEQFTDKRQGGPTAKIQYANYVPVDNRLFSFSRAINMSNAGVNYFLDMNYTSMDFDRVIDFPFSIPKNYTVK
ncbi:MAG: DUF4292 domain-containing protein [Bacteroidetes bacterium]|nr:DUF4292 domain-containing protein [Bacteroidota bacterium]